MPMATQKRNIITKNERPTMDSISVTPNPSEKAGRIRIDAPQRAAAQTEAILPENVVITASDFSFFYGTKAGVEKITMDIEVGSITAIIGPSGCGKSTFLRCISLLPLIYDLL